MNLAQKSTTVYFNMALVSVILLVFLARYYHHFASHRWAHPHQSVVSISSSYNRNGCTYRYFTPGGVEGDPIDLDWNSCVKLREIAAAPSVDFADLRRRANETGSRLYPQFVTGLCNPVDRPGYKREFPKLFAARYKNWMAAMPAGQKLIVYDLNVVYDPAFFDNLADIVQWDPDHVELRRFPFERYAPHVGELLTYAFKQIIVAEIAAEFGAALWVDIPMSFQYPAQLLPDFLIYDDPARWREMVPDGRWSKWKLESEGCMFYYNNPTWHSIDWGTHPDMYNFLPFEDGQSMRHTRQWASHHVVYNTPYCMQYFIAPSVACSMRKECISPLNSAKRCPGNLGWWAGGTRCHRQDQSIVNVLSTNMCGPGWEGCTMEAAEFAMAGLPNRLASLRRSLSEANDEVKDMRTKLAELRIRKVKPY